MDSTLVSTYLPDARDSFGQYMIMPGNLHVFPFQVPMFGSITIGYAHILPNSQDFSIDGWISEEFIDSRLFPHFKFMRRKIDITVYCSYLKVDERDERWFVDSSKDNYMQVKNLQNSKNAYELTFLPSNV